MKLSISHLAIPLSIATPAAAFAQQPYSPFCGDHMWGGDWQGWFFGPISMIVFIALAIVVVVFLVRWLGAPTQRSALHSPSDITPLDILNERFAKGEIDKEEFEERRRMLD